MAARNIEACGDSNAKTGGDLVDVVRISLTGALEDRARQARAVHPNQGVPFSDAKALLAAVVRGFAAGGAVALAAEHGAAPRSAPDEDVRPVDPVVRSRAEMEPCAVERVREDAAQGLSAVVPAAAA